MCPYLFTPSKNIGPSMIATTRTKPGNDLIITGTTVDVGSQIVEFGLRRVAYCESYFSYVLLHPVTDHPSFH